MNPATSGSTKNSNWALLLIIPLCLVLGVVFLATTFGVSDGEATVQALDPAWYSHETARGATLKNKIMVGNCFLCHAYWTGIPDPDVRRPKYVHGVIALEHGANNRCYNCHLIHDRNKYAADDGSGIMPENVEQLCARCHGLVYNDWQAGTHGVRRGKWDAQTQFDRQTFDCTHCHDPHAPKFEYKVFAPPPVWPEKFIRSDAGMQADH
jgi:hypothetical protein